MPQQLLDFLRTPILPQPFVIGRGILPVMGKMILGGTPKSGKSFLLLNMMIDLAMGRNLFSAYYPSGTPVFPVARPWRVLYLEQELGEQGMLERFLGKDGDPGILTGYTDDDLRDVPLFVRPRTTKMRLDTDDGHKYIADEIAACKGEVVFGDPMAKFHLGEENDSQEMGAVLRGVDHLIEDFKISWGFVHHTVKPPLDPRFARHGGDKLRGSSAIFGDVDTVIDLVTLSPEDAQEAVFQLGFETRRGKPIEKITLLRKGDGTCEYLENYRQPMTETSSLPRKSRHNRYDHL